MTARIIERAKTMSLPLLGLDNLGRRPEGVRAYAVTFDASNVPGGPISTLSFAVRIWDGDDEGKLDGALDAIERDLNRIIETSGKEGAGIRVSHRADIALGMCNGAFRGGPLRWRQESISHGWCCSPGISWVDAR